MTIKVSFDELRKEATREPVELEMPDGPPIVVEFPTGNGVKEIAGAVSTGDDELMLTALVGEEAAKRLLALFPDAPGDLNGRVVKAIFESWGGTPDGFFGSPASST